MNILQTTKECVCNFLEASIVIHLYSSTKFAVETIIGAMTCLIFYLLYLEVDKIDHRFNLIHKTRYKLQKALNEMDSSSKECSTSQTIATPSDLGVKVIFQNDVVKLKSNCPMKTKINHILSVTPEDYIRQGLMILKRELQQSGDHDDEKTIFKRYLPLPEDACIWEDDSSVISREINHIKSMDITSEKSYRMCEM